MELINSQLPSDHDLILFGDNHRGNALEKRDAFRECIEAIGSNKKTYAIHMGDAIEAITFDDYRFDPITNATPPIYQVNEIEGDLKPIRKKILTVLQGNHEYALRRFGDITEDLARRLGVRYGTYSAAVTISDNKGQMYKIYVSHGFGSINSTLDDPTDRLNAMKRSLRRKLMRKAGDCLIMAMGHTHKLIVAPPIDELYLTSDTKIRQHYVKQIPDTNYIPQQQRWYVNTGSFLGLFGDGVSGYAERAGYDPLEIGYPVIEVRDRKVTGIKRVVL